MQPIRYEPPVLSFLFAVVSRARSEDGEAVLLDRVARADRAALRKLYDRMGAHALAVALRVLGSRMEAEEVVQDAFVDIWERSAQFDAARGSGRTWVLSIARNRAIDRLRSRGAAGRMADQVRVDATAQPPSSSPLEDVEKREVRERVQAALASLSAEQRRAIELAYFEGLSHSEICERLGEPLGTVKSRVRAAMEKLAADLLPGGGRR